MKLTNTVTSFNGQNRAFDGKPISMGTLHTGTGSGTGSGTGTGTGTGTVTVTGTGTVKLFMAVIVAMT